MLKQSDIVLPECLDHWAERVRAAEERAEKAEAKSRELELSIDRLQRVVDQLRGLSGNVRETEVAGQPRYYIDH